jgi:hypothetical protein
VAYREADTATAAIRRTESEGHERQDGWRLREQEKPACW